LVIFIGLTGAVVMGSLYAGHATVGAAGAAGAARRDLESVS